MSRVRQKVYPFAHRIVDKVIIDNAYPGTACGRLLEVTNRVLNLGENALVGKSWQDIRSILLWCGGLKEIASTGHAFMDDNHCDLTTMLGNVQKNSNESGEIPQISKQNFLGDHIKRSSVADLGEGGSWSTCTNGCNQIPPHDVAHVQFKSRIAFKLVWCPPKFEKFVLVDDEGKLLKVGKPLPVEIQSVNSLTSNLPDMLYRRSNYELTRGGKYATAAEREGAAG
ncbi:uncharacterized protein LOC142347924 [Convolutriloba macropyga]|uniref:uncharacterized protein LOC142347924 n=1 Tax=Convolutriloba macropyga TaxID=536237 RepID=UPI003F525EA0